MRPQIRDLISDVATTFGIEHLTDEEFVGRDRHKTLAEARAVAIWCARKRFRMSFPELGREFGNRDHTTCISACRKIDKELAKYPESWLSEQARAAFARADERHELIRGLVSTTGAREIDLGLLGTQRIGAAE